VIHHTPIGFGYVAGSSFKSTVLILFVGKRGVIIKQGGAKKVEKINFRKIIDRGLVVGLALIAVTAICYTGGTVLAITHMQPFNQCDMCGECDTNACDRVVANR
jgi:hypothetical protein